MRPPPAFFILPATLKLLANSSQLATAPKIGVLMALYKPTPDTTEASCKINRSSFYRVIYDAVLHAQGEPPDGRRVHPSVKAVINDTSAAIITAALADVFTASKADDDDSDANHNAVFRHISHIRGMFTKHFSDVLAADPLNFTVEARFFDRPNHRRKKSYIAPAIPIVRKVHDQLRVEWQDPARDLNVCFIVLFALWAGLRSGEITHARRTWFESDGGVCRIRIGSDPGVLINKKWRWGYKPKGGKGRLVTIPAWLHALAIKYGGPVYLLGGNMAERCVASVTNSSEWLYDQGLRSNNRNHELRKLFACMLNNGGHSPDYIRRQLGHKSEQGMWPVYVGHGLPPNGHRFWAENLDVLV